MRHAFLSTTVFTAITIAFLGLAGASHLAAATTVRVAVNAYDQNGGNSHDTGDVAALSITADTGLLSDFGGSFQAKGYAQFDPVFGPLLGTYSNMVNTYALYQSFTPAEAWWGTSFTVTGTPGAQITFNLGIDLHDFLSAVEDPNAPSNLGAETFASLTGTGAAAGLSVVDHVTSLSSSLAASRSVWKSMTYTVGTVVTVGGDLYTEADAQDGTARADAFNTGRFALQVVTPGGGYTTDSGVVFASSFDQTAVPEPSTIALSGLSSLALLIACACKTRSAGAPKNQD